MNQELRQQKLYKLSTESGCSHHHRDAFEMLESDCWSRYGITKEDFGNDDVFGKIEEKAIGEFSPRQRMAYEVIKSRFVACIGNAYVLGRNIRNNNTKELDVANFDEIIISHASYGCVQFCGRRGYELKYPFSAALDKAVGYVAGAVLSPVGFLTGMMYTPKKLEEAVVG